ncbi:MAG: hypothetical protein GW779_05305 [Candidatus Altiarchaeum hamiconexum]|uniref:Transcription factor E n=1 Tax=Candidatus Altarchaeum hamiconexum TaxID=1803513 RepID=A0A8J8CG33_9ARCH|nr:hypothetical protein [Candidatus Altarchaeum hamiconexum]OIQ05577.1 MAG: hypothetical protein AUK59_03305 [Candidatus Altarchaeum sp. CG2_30_32_3053]PIN67584.1 MAG: hypothetical protein COV98_02330 [Candidatus Altarchaeum sp. CG12_big_fil_rev_8_21_14_0_65_33_22]PIV28618.1 MAG: hypothetical protein COS36_01540 [Candidatus Altarchaeum sp. CG03_land_8_20_14_0_80_32_618]PIX49041.1 MAG: hypothetical protein COZ53_01965 [Candidatus Altarchaeum sp. CG_4_8_14_3_um_filter_33_2054]PIZ33234.1 MAG: hyp
MPKVITAKAQNFSRKESKGVGKGVGKVAGKEAHKTTNENKKAAKIRRQPKSKNAGKAAAVAESIKPDVVKFSKIYENKNVNEILLKFFEEGCVDILPELNEYIRDEIISNRKNVKAPTVRKWLNLMHSYGLVEYTKTKDKQSGWFTYRWKIRTEKIAEFAMSDIDKEMNALLQKTEEIKAHNFVCDCREWTYVEALESNFICFQCGKVIMNKDNDGLIDEMEGKKDLLEKKKKDIFSEL